MQFTVVFSLLVISAGAAGIEVLGNGQVIPPNIPFVSPVWDTQFGKYCLGDTTPIQKRFTVRNSGTGPVNVSPITPSSNDFSVSVPMSTSTLAPGASSTFSIMFTPSSSFGAKESQVKVTSNDAALPSYSFTVLGVVQTAEIEASPSGNVGIPLRRIRLGVLKQGDKPVTRSFTVNNYGLCGAQVAVVTKTQMTDGSPSQGLTLGANTGTFTLAPNQQQSVSFSFNPEMAGTFVGIIALEGPFDTWSIEVSCEVTPNQVPTPKPTTPKPTTLKPTSQPTRGDTGPAPTPCPATGFCWGSTCDPGDGKFDKPLPNAKSTEVIGVLPPGKWNVRIDLTSKEDLDITLVDLDDMSKFPGGQYIVQWCSTPDLANPQKNCGVLGQQKGRNSTKYKGIEIIYSGYNGDFDVTTGKGSKGNEYIQIVGMTTIRMEMRAYAYKHGSASVTYSWGQGCGGAFVAAIGTKEIVQIGQIPPGKSNIDIRLVSNVDIDIQLYDLDNTAKFSEGQAIIAYCSNKATCNFGSMAIKDANEYVYEGVRYKYSGYNGVLDPSTGFQLRGNEYIKIEGRSNRNLQMSFYGYKNGTAQVIYSYDVTF